MKILMWVFLAAALLPVPGIIARPAIAAAPAFAILKVEDADPKAAAALPVAVHGRVRAFVAPSGRTLYERQWPGTYIESTFQGAAALFEVGPGKVHLRVTIDDAPPVSLLKPAPGIYRISGLAPGQHRLRIQVVSESQEGPTTLGGVYADVGAGTRPLPLAGVKRQIEFIGDSHTVGYGNTSPRRECSSDEVWTSTDASLGIAGRVARRYDADYQVNAISGRGVVRNYGGASGDTLPVAYPHILFDKAARYEDPAWSPDLIVVSLGTNDFSTPLKSGEKWATREALRADFAKGYLAFLQDLRWRRPGAFITLWTTDGAENEIADAVIQVYARMKAAGDRRIGLVKLEQLAMSGCDYHPGLADDAVIAAAIARVIDEEAALAKTDP